jgi:hypothetical protein
MRRGLIADTKSTSYTYSMAGTKKRTPQALRAVLARKNIEIRCTLVFEDESVSYPSVRSASVRGAQREITGVLVKHGYAPAGRWSDPDEDDDGFSEWTRTFTPGPAADFMIADLPLQVDGSAD